MPQKIISLKIATCSLNGIEPKKTTRSNDKEYIAERCNTFQEKPEQPREEAVSAELRRENLRSVSPFSKIYEKILLWYEALEIRFRRFFRLYQRLDFQASLLREAPIEIEHIQSRDLLLSDECEIERVSEECVQEESSFFPHGILWLVSEVNLREIQRARTLLEAKIRQEFCLLPRESECLHLVPGICVLMPSLKISEIQRVTLTNDLRAKGSVFLSDFDSQENLISILIGIILHENWTLSEDRETCLWWQNFEKWTSMQNSPEQWFKEKLDGPPIWPLKQSKHCTCRLR